MTACGGNNVSDDPAVESSHNGVDVSFATEMVLHHRQAIDMADLALNQSTDPHVVDLAGQIKDAQGSEIDTMRDWCSDWNAPAPRAGMSSMRGMSTMPGMRGDMTWMMSETDMDRLTGMSDGQFDTRWLAMMIRHHRGAVAMARSELDNGRNESAKDLAGDVIDEQRTEIRTMQDLMPQMTH